MCVLQGRLKALKSVQQRLDGGGALKIYSPFRELIKEGKIKSIAPKTTKRLERYVFLVGAKTPIPFLRLLLISALMGCFHSQKTFTFVYW